MPHTTHANDMGDADPCFSMHELTEVVQLTARVARSGEHLTEQKHLLMAGLREMVQAEYWVWVQMRPDEGNQTAGQPPAMAPIDLQHNFPPAIQGFVVSGVNDPEAACPAAGKVFDQLTPGGHVTRSRQQLVTDRRWYDSPHYNLYRQGCGIDDCLYSFYMLDEAPVVSALALHRRSDQPPFNARDIALTHVLFGQLRWLHEAAVPHDRGEKVLGLTVRQREVLGHLLEGSTVPDTAERMGLSANTVNTHVKAIYKHFGVSSRAALVKGMLLGSQLP